MIHSILEENSKAIATRWAMSMSTRIKSTILNIIIVQEQMGASKTCWKTWTAVKSRCCKRSRSISKYIYSTGNRIHDFHPITCIFLSNLISHLTERFWPLPLKDIILKTSMTASENMPEYFLKFWYLRYVLNFNISNAIFVLKLLWLIL